MKAFNHPQDISGLITQKNQFLKDSQNSPDQGERISIFSFKPRQPLLQKRIDPSSLKIDHGRDALFTDFGIAVLRDRYLLSGETCQGMFARVSCAFADDLDHAQRLYDAMSQFWFMPSTPILSNGGTTRGLPISCYLNSVDDSLESIAETWNENIWLAANGGGIGSYWGNVRSVGERVKGSGETSGIIPFIHVMDSLTLAISQGSLRRGSAAVYLDVHHPEIEEFLDMRKPSGDFNRKGFNLHHALNITDKFMEAVTLGIGFDLLSPKDQSVIKTVDARSLWERILETRVQTGEPYLLFIDTVNNAIPEHHKILNLQVQSSNLCSEITLPTGRDLYNKNRTAVCCLSSLNLEKWDEWADQPQLIEDVLRMLDNVLSHFIENAPSTMNQARYSADRERSVGLGVMGFHSLLQQKNIPFESLAAKLLNQKIFKYIHKQAHHVSRVLADERGACLDAVDADVSVRFSNMIAVAPTASISIICGGASACIEPIPGNYYNHKTLSGAFPVKNPYLQKILAEKNQDTDIVWESILEHQGSVQHLTCLTQKEKDIFKTAFELDQRWLIDFAADRAPYICQSQSLNLYLYADIDKWDLHMLHYTAWQKKIKSLYYCRSKSLQRAGFVGAIRCEESEKEEDPSSSHTRYEECLACQ